MKKTTSLSHSIDVKQSARARWNPNADIDNNGAVDIDDLLILIDHFWEHW